MWVGKKSPSNPVRKDKHTGRKTKSQLDHLWEDHDWQEQLKDYLEHEQRLYSLDIGKR
jgi:hypothetical protein